MQQATKVYDIEKYKQGDNLIIKRRVMMMGSHLLTILAHYKK